MDAILFIAAALLGLLAFFEPCTIATHTLFAARANRYTAWQRWFSLTQLVVSRTALLATLFGSAAWVGLESIAPGKALVILGIIGGVYLVTRKIYLPVPHLEFFRLLPGHARLPQGLRLGLTLPACTLPLVAVVGVLSALTGLPSVGLGAGVVFAGMFSLPTLWDSVRGLDAAHLAFLGKAANISPYITAMLLWGGALVIWTAGS